MIALNTKTIIKKLKYAEKCISRIEKAELDTPRMENLQKDLNSTLQEVAELMAELRVNIEALARSVGIQRTTMLTLADIEVIRKKRADRLLSKDWPKDNVD